jgi:hypothetical protein
LTLLENQDKFAYLRDSEGVLSLPPLTNAEKSKISASSKNVLIEITSSTGVDICKKVMEELLLEMIKAGITSSELDQKVEALDLNGGEAPAADGKLRHTVIMQQVRTVDAKGSLKTVYPSRVDLNFGDSNKMRVVRLYTD